MNSRRQFLITQILWFLAGCGLSKTTSPTDVNKLTLGIVAYGEEQQLIDRYTQFIHYLEGQTKSLIELEPAYNEIQALEQIQHQEWSLVFAPPGLAAIAVAKSRYMPLFPLEGVNNLSSVLVVLDNSPITHVEAANGKIVGLGQRGSATGYYVPLYELYGTTPSEVLMAPTPRAILEWVARGKVDIGAVAKDELERYRMEFKDKKFRIIDANRRIPAGSVLISPNVEARQVELIKTAMENVLPTMAEAVGYIPNSPPPDYTLLIEFIQKVEPIEANLHSKPAPLYQGGGKARQGTSRS